MGVVDDFLEEREVGLTEEDRFFVANQLGVGLEERLLLLIWEVLRCRGGGTGR